ncbi:hypothetical protein BDM02DRAFT_3105232 [Thelephora ganbajun]|uniref:Uncharacterized protein n=1 Tax=Thelephora ganbajun TaxID=370292 RepID=A0ACB6YZ90_THEGA|nr:hypothetical protein BDM02DRAFT_3105232 [Thelephora ganbajun]
MHLLINPTGQLGKFRAVDWAVELLNLFTKDTHSGSYSNKTIENILKESPLVEMYRQLGKMIEGNFCMTKKTTKHQGPDMKRTFEEILLLMKTNGTHVMEQGHESRFTVNRNLEIGLESIQQTAKGMRVGAGASENNENTQPRGLETGEDNADLDEEDLMLDNE